ncbi:nucleic acid-binding, OB-fold-like protein [Artemisia annua]|uniref:CST complex subunit STN1 n=1 Tax=Artemisia annua TaxID=35608 RepID=A0A2U1NTZ0_ARTAN|nr:nucleic acid-binding, OB-fold-like protein [Artemisia annua]
MNSLSHTHVKLLAFDFLSLAPSPSHPPTILKPTTKTPITRIETLGIVTLRDHKPDKFLKFYIDDGTGCIPCVLWLNHLTSPYFSRHSPPSVRSLAENARKFAGLVQVGSLVRVRGKVGVFRGCVQVNVGDVFVERDANAEILHWLQCVRLGRVCYDGGRVDDDKMIVD